MQIMFDLETYEVSAGTMIFLVPGQPCHVRSAEDLEGVIIRFPVTLMRLDPDSHYPGLACGSSRLFEVEASAATNIMCVVQCMRQELTDTHNQQIQVLAAYLKIVLIYLFRQRYVLPRSVFKHDMTVLARRFFDLLECRYHNIKKVSEYADELAVTPNYLNQIVKQETGISVSANIRKRLLLQAKRMALVEGVSMKTVAYKLGFDDIAHFSKFFKTGCGCNFTDYRKTSPISNGNVATR
ncbi:hypothetical protein GCM10010967_57510 [Dyadobacter beijingensis]|uniref:HTH araC/xylS-type domain-containing protein n=2 Tax=Dyadobacter beijingensis TaxID=365489 RepID=A0ABQ2IMY3_9BACT|nr:hypothetical protein GCM10010967_57510 [Dyadobacter beijingensis]